MKKIFITILFIIGITSLSFGQITINGSGSYTTIQDAIDAATAGDIINVPAGTYEEFINIDKALTLKGAFAEVSGYDASRGVDETIITPPNDATRIAPAGSTTPLIYNEAENVTIDGFTLIDEKDGNGEYGANNAIMSFAGSFTASNNRVLGLPKYGIAVWRYAGDVETLGTIVDVVISNNYIFGAAISDLTATWAYGISLLGTVANVTNNVIEQSRVGIAVQPYNQSSVEITTDGLVDGNVFETYSQGVFYHAGGVSGHYAVSGNWTFSNNEFKLTDELPDGIQTGDKYTAVYTRMSWCFFDKAITYSTNTFDVSNVDQIGYVKTNIQGFTFRNDIYHNFLQQHTSDDINLIYTGNTFTSDDFLSYFDRGSDGYPAYPPMEVDLSVIKAGNTFTDGSIIFGEKLVPPSEVNVVNVTQGLGYETIQAAIDAATAGDVIEVAGGTYNELISVAHMGMEIHGTGTLANPTILDGTGLSGISGTSLVHFIETDDVNNTLWIHGFTFANPPTTGAHRNIVNIEMVQNGGKVKVTDNIVDCSTSDPVDIYGVNAHTCNSTGEIVINSNTFNGCAGNSILIERVEGPCEIGYNTINQAEGGGSAIYSMSYSNGSGDHHVTGKHWYHDNIITSAGTGGYGLTIASAPYWLSGGSGGTYSNVDVSNNEISNIASNGSGINLQVGGTNAGIPNAVINNNLISSVAGTSTNNAIVLKGPVTGTSLSGNSLSGFGVGILASGQDIGGTLMYPSSIAAHDNNLSGNLDFGMQNDNPTATINATNNYWGTTVESEIQALISGDVDYDPWLGKTESAAISDPGVDVPVGTSGVTMNFGTLPSGGGSVDVSLIPEAPADGPGGGLALYLDISSDMTNYTFNVTITVDVSGFSGFDASTIVMYYNSTTESWVAVSGGVYNATAETYTFTTNHFTPFTFVNTPSTAYDVFLSTSTTAASGLIYPNDTWGTTSYEANDWDFEAPAEFYIVPEENAEFGACDITLQWDTDMFSFDGVDNTGGIFDPTAIVNGVNFTFLSNDLGDVSTITINASRLDNDNFTIAADDYIAKLSLNLLKPGYGAIDFIAMNFRAFDGSGGQEGVYVVGNGAEVKSYLGDVTTNGDASTGDGAVDFHDLSLWSGSYWSGVTGFSGGMTNYKVKYDVGPTADNTVYTLPQADDQIQFEDLMIFSISYGLSANSVYPKVPAMPEEPIELKLGEGLLSGQYRIIPVELEGSISDVRGISLSFSGQVEEVQKGELLEKGETPTLLLNRQLEGIHNVDMSVVGYDAETINLSGTIAYIKVKEGEKISIASADIRNSRNQKFNLKISGTSSAVPESFELSQNYPNPFNPTTMIKYQLPEDRQVVLKVYNALGQQVTELVNEVQKAGYYEVQLNGSDLSSGVYFYHITAGDFTSVKKMMLIK